MARKVTKADIQDSMRAAGLVRIGGGSINEYWGLPGQKPGVGHFVKLRPKKFELVRRYRGQYGRKLEDAPMASHFYGKLEPDKTGYSVGKTMLVELESRQGGGDQLRTLDEQVRYYLNRWQAGRSAYRRHGEVEGHEMTGEELMDLAVAFKATYPKGEVVFLRAKKFAEDHPVMSPVSYGMDRGVERLLEDMARADTSKMHYLGQCDQLRKRSEENEAYWHRMMDGAEPIDIKRFKRLTEYNAILDDDETLEQFIESDLDAGFYLSTWGDRPAAFLQVAGFEFIWSA